MGTFPKYSIYILAHRRVPRAPERPGNVNRDRIMHRRSAYKVAPDDCTEIAFCGIPPKGPGFPYHLTPVRLRLPGIDFSTGRFGGERQRRPARPSLSLIALIYVVRLWWTCLLRYYGLCFARRPL